MAGGVGYRKTRSYENIERRLFDGVGQYDIPQLAPIDYDGGCEFIGFNYAATAKKRDQKGIHFFLDDYQFNRVWFNADRYVELLQQFRYVMTPDFSMYTDFPKAIQIYNHYRKHWIGAYLQAAGVDVIATVSWSTEDSFTWCFDGEPEGGTVAVSSVGCMKGKRQRDLFIAGYKEMVSRLYPDKIIFYGDIPRECTGNIVRIRAFQDKFKEVQCDGW